MKIISAKLEINQMECYTALDEQPLMSLWGGCKFTDHVYRVTNLWYDFFVLEIRFTNI